MNEHKENIRWMVAMVFIVLFGVMIIAWLAGKRQELMIDKFASDENCDAVVKAYARLQIDIGCRDGRVIHYMR